MPIVIHLHGSATATYGEASYTARGNGHDPIPPLVRRLIAEEIIEDDDLVTVARGDLVCFKPCRASRWAEIDVVDTDDGIVRRSAYIGPYAKGALALAERLGKTAQKGRKQTMGRAAQAEARV
jgi:hypothetical protein